MINLFMEFKRARKAKVYKLKQGDYFALKPNGAIYLYDKEMMSAISLFTGKGYDIPGDREVLVLERVKGGVSW